jgi:hypothetical protein
MISPGVAVHTKGFESRFQFSMYDLIALMSTRREVNVPRLIACLVMILNQISTWFNQELPVGVKWKVTPGCCKHSAPWLRGAGAAPVTGP